MKMKWNKGQQMSGQGGQALTQQEPKQEPITQSSQTPLGQEPVAQSSPTPLGQEPVKQAPEIKEPQKSESPVQGKPEPKKPSPGDPVFLSTADRLQFLLFQERINSRIERKNYLMAQMALFKIQFDNCQRDNQDLDQDGKKIEEDRSRWLKDRSEHYGIDLSTQGTQIDDETGKVTLPTPKTKPSA